MMKQLWAIDKAYDRLWLEWIDTYYTKGRSVLFVRIPTTSTWNG